MKFYFCLLLTTLSFDQSFGQMTCNELLYSKPIRIFTVINHKNYPAAVKHQKKGLEFAQNLLFVAFRAENFIQDTTSQIDLGAVIEDQIHQAVHQLNLVTKPRVDETVVAVLERLATNLNRIIRETEGAIGHDLNSSTRAQIQNALAKMLDTSNARNRQYIFRDVKNEADLLKFRDSVDISSIYNNNSITPLGINRTVSEKNLEQALKQHKAALDHVSNVFFNTFQQSNFNNSSASPESIEIALKSAFTYLSSLPLPRKDKRMRASLIELGDYANRYLSAIERELGVRLTENAEDEALLALSILIIPPDRDRDRLSIMADAQNQADNSRLQHFTRSERPHINENIKPLGLNSVITRDNYDRALRQQSIGLKYLKNILTVAFQPVNFDQSNSTSLVTLAHIDERINKAISALTEITTPLYGRKAGLIFKQLYSNGRLMMNLLEEQLGVTLYEGVKHSALASINFLSPEIDTSRRNSSIARLQMEVESLNREEAQSEPISTVSLIEQKQIALENDSIEPLNLNTAISRSNFTSALKQLAISEGYIRNVLVIVFQTEYLNREIDSPIMTRIKIKEEINKAMEELAQVIEIEYAVEMGVVIEKQVAVTKSLITGIELRIGEELNIEAKELAVNLLNELLVRDRRRRQRAIDRIGFQPRN